MCWAFVLATVASMAAGAHAQCVSMQEASAALGFDPDLGYVGAVLYYADGGSAAFPTEPELLPFYQKLAGYLTLTEQADNKDRVTLFLPGDYAMLNEYEDDVLAALPNPPSYPPSEVTYLNHLVPQYFPTEALREIDFLGGTYATLLDEVLDDVAPGDYSKRADITINRNLPSLINSGPAPYIDDFDKSFYVLPQPGEGDISPLNEIFPSAITENGLNIETCAGVLHVVGYLLYPHPDSVPVLGGSVGGPGYGDEGGVGYGSMEDAGAY